jgi:hypothetical protein
MHARFGGGEEMRLDCWRGVRDGLRQPVRLSAEEAPANMPGSPDGRTATPRGHTGSEANSRRRTWFNSAPGEAAGTLARNHGRQSPEKRGPILRGASSA